MLFSFYSQHVLSYAVHVLNDERNSHDPASWSEAHRLTIIKDDNDDCSKHEMYVNHHQIRHPNFQYDCTKSTLTWQQGSGDNFHAGNVFFSGDATIGRGSMQVGEHHTAVKLTYLNPHYRVSLSTNAGAALINNKLTWDTDSDAWKNAEWVDSGLIWSYALKEIKIVGQVINYTEVTFEDPKAEDKTSWVCDDSGGATFNDQCTTTLDKNGRFVFTANDGVIPPTYSRPTALDGIKSVSPYQMAFDFDELAYNITGGAMLVDQKDETGQVLAMKGVYDQDPSIVGNYVVSHDGVPRAQFGVSHGKLVIRNQRIESSSVKGSTLQWSNVPEDLASEAGLPTGGVMMFSNRGQSASVQGEQKWLAVHRFVSPHIAVAASNLNIYTLVNMDPHEKKNNDIEDIVQMKSMDDFYSVIKYYMKQDLRESFISANPPDIKDIREIAEDNPDDNKAFYRTLSVPYLVNALSSSPADDAKYLNGRRAAKWLKMKIADDKVFKNQSHQLYTRQWQKKFPAMTDFLLDQANNTAKYNPFIKEDAEKWVKEVREDIGDDPDQQESLKKFIAMIENLSNYATTNGKYWAYTLFRFLASPFYLGKLKLQLMNPNTSSALTLDVKRYTAILAILDDRSQFAQQFLETLKIFQLTSVLPEMLDYEGNRKTFDILVEKAMKAFVDKYIDSTDPEMAKRAEEVQEVLKKKSLHDYLTLFHASCSEMAGAFQWDQFIGKFDNAVVRIFGKAASAIGTLVGLAAAAGGIVFLATGMIQWEDLDGAEKASLLTPLVSTFITVVKNIVLRGLKASAVFESVGTKLSALKCFVTGRGFELIEYPEQFFSNGFAKWLIKEGTEAPTFMEVLFENATDLEAAYPRLTKAFGRNLDEFMATRFAAALAIVNIVLSAINLANAETTMDEVQDGLFLASGILELVSAVAGWIAGSIAAESTAATVLSTIASFAGPLGILAAIAGVIVLFVVLGTHKDPETPLHHFVHNDAKDEGFFMQHATDIDYFQVISDESGKTRELGVALHQEGNEDRCLSALSDGSITISGITYDYDTILSIQTDEDGYAKFLTLLYNPESKDSLEAVALTLDEGKLSMTGKNTDKPKTQLWIAECQGDVQEDDDKHLIAASFYLKNAQSQESGSTDYLTVVNGKVTVSSTPMKWKLVMKGMKPEWLNMEDISITTSTKGRTFHNQLIQGGSKSNLTWHINPRLPDWLKLNETNGDISQTKTSPPVSAKESYTLTVRNALGSASDSFSIEVTGVKPNHLSMGNISMTTSSKRKTFKPYISEPGSDNGREWTVSPILPKWLKINSTNGYITQTDVNPTVFPPSDFTMTCKNDFGSAETTFSIEVTQA